MILQFLFVSLILISLFYKTTNIIFKAGCHDNKKFSKMRLSIRESLNKKNNLMKLNDTYERTHILCRYYITDKSYYNLNSNIANE